jgi:hypothetical protein
MLEQHTAKQQLVAFLHHRTLDADTVKFMPLVPQCVYRYSERQEFVLEANRSSEQAGILAFSISVGI